MRISKHTQRQIDNLIGHTGETQTGIIAMAIDRLVRDELGVGMTTKRLATIALEHWDNTQETSKLLETIRDNPTDFCFSTFDELSNYILAHTDYYGA